MLLDKIPSLSKIDGNAVPEEGRGTLSERIAAFIASLCILLVLFVTAGQAVCYWIPNWWRNEYAKYDTPSYVTGEMSLDDAVHVTEDMLEYCIGRLDTLDDTEATIDGVTAPFFTEREKEHLSDCRDIFQALIRARMLALMIGAVLIIYIYVHRGKRDTLKIVSRGYLHALYAVMAITIAIVVMAIWNFNFVFTEFHHIFFDNDLWILNPKEDNLVNIMQEVVFADAAKTIAAIWVATCLVLAGFALHFIRSKRPYTQDRP